MYPANYNVVRLAGDADEHHLRLLAQLNGAAPLEHPILVAEVDTGVVAALSMHDRRGVGDPLVRTGPLLAHLRLRADAFDAHARVPSLRARLRVA